MESTRMKDISDITTLIRACYGRFNSYRIANAGMQELTELYQFVAIRKKPAAASLM